MQICQKCFDDMRMVTEPKLHFVCDNCGNKDENWVETGEGEQAKIILNSKYGKFADRVALRFTSDGLYLSNNFSKGRIYQITEVTKSCMTILDDNDKPIKLDNDKIMHYFSPVVPLERFVKMVVKDLRIK